MARRLLPPDPWGITPYAQRVMDGADPKTFYNDPAFRAPAGMYRGGGKVDYMAERKRITKGGADALFSTAPQNRSKGQVIRDTGAARATKAKTPTGESQRTTTARKLGQAAEEIDIDNLPILSAPWMKIQERTFSLSDPENEHKDLETQLRLTDALTPGRLQEALNRAEDNARRAHKLYIVAQFEYESFELEMKPVIEAMRQSANTDLQGEKDRKERSKAITDADITGRASVLFPDEWIVVQQRTIKAALMMSHLKIFADVWKQRCFSISSMLNAGKRS